MNPPPHDLDSERQFLGALLVRPNLIPEADARLKPDELYLEAHRNIYLAILEENRKVGEGETVDALQIAQHLGDHSQLGQIGGTGYVLSLAQDVMVPGSALRHAQRIKGLALRRKLIAAADKIGNEARLPIEDEPSFLRGVEDSILRITNQNFYSGPSSVRELRPGLEEHIEQLLKSGGKITGLETHFKEFDRLSSGLKEGELIIVAARPGLGKTTFALNVAANAAIRGGKTVLLYSLEMSQIELMIRLVCSRSQLNHEQLKLGHVSSERLNDLRNSIDEICKSPLYIDDTGDLTIWDCVSRTRKFRIDMEQQGRSLGLVIVDYLQLMSDPDARKLGRQHEVATISRCLKQLARTVRAPVIAVSQMNRSVEQRRGDLARPQLSDLRESGAIEQDADIVMFIYHDFKENEEEQTEEDLAKKGTVEMIIAKHRNGPIGNFRLIFRPQINQFADAGELTESISKLGW